MFEILLGNSAESRQEFSGWELLLKGSIPDHLYIYLKITDQYFLLTNRPKRFEGKNNGGRVSSEMDGGKQSSESGQMRKDIDST